MTPMRLHFMMGGVFCSLSQRGKCMQVTILRLLSVTEHVAGQVYTGVGLSLAAETDGMPR